MFTCRYNALWTSLAALAGFVLVTVPAAAAPPPSAKAVAHFETRVRPLLVARCQKCHGPEKQRGGLRLDSVSGATRGGDSGPAIVPSKPDESLLIRAVRQSSDLKMPPDKKLREQEIADLVAWVRDGAPWPAEKTVAPAGRFTAEQKAFWSFRPVRKPPLPAVAAREGPTSPIDVFVLAALEAKSLKPAPPADRRTLLRRVTFDLLGLPPAPAEVDAFLNDHSPDAWERVVDRLLASPHYGERWARHWLDVVRYADTTANDANAVMRYAWRYRDYVVNALNADKPYDRFVIEQLAGDLLPGEADRVERVIATGFLMVGPKALAETDKEQTRLDIVDEQLDVTSRAFLGLTVGCARCHDHKFDPIPTLDYYSLAGIFRSTEPFRDEVRNASMWQEWPLLLPTSARLAGRGTAFGESSFPWGPLSLRLVIVMAPKEGKPVDLRVHVRGSRFNLGPVAPRRFLQILAGEDHAPLKTAGSGRLELARWIASANNPLAARVMVNRLWQHHFGTGLVATSDNFGTRGERPSHPELLDYLAARFVASGWSLKALHRLLLLSSTYRMACVDNATAARLDPDNRLLWRMPRRRLEAEALRDAVLAVSGRLDRALGGGEAGEFLFREAEIIDAKRGFPVNRVKGDHPHYTQSVRRSLYLPVVRNLLPDVLALFDPADPNGVTAARTETTVPSQALFLLNHPFVREASLHFARSLLVVPGDEAARVRVAHARAFARPPSPDDVADALAFLKEYTGRARRGSRDSGSGRSGADARLAAWQSYCQMLFCSNEFAYLD
ncbi:MAG: PSD1 domain-containing protein [Planctomycetes bacterium]|nr:PSD1 domain-containing protein [Planctomycetota bacterium]